ncbi:MAG: hypothetical protein CMG96_09395 [Marinovum sp.]|nr:hypothetical protein [Marinovum sp.]
MNKYLLTGAALIIVSAVLFSAAGALTKSVTATAWMIIFWCGLFAGILTLIVLVMSGQLLIQLRCLRWPALMASAFSLLGTIAFIPAFQMTSVAKVALIYATVPFMAAALGWAALGERPARRTAAAAVICFIGVAITFKNASFGSALAGDALAAFMTVMMADHMLIFRKYPDTPAGLTSVMSNLLVLPLAWIWISPLSIELPQLPLLVLFGAVTAGAFVTLSQGAKALPASLTALLSILETPLAPIWAWFILSEIPSNATLIGGAVIMFAVLYALYQPPKALIPR